MSIFNGKSKDEEQVANEPATKTTHTWEEVTEEPETPSLVDEDVAEEADEELEDTQEISTGGNEKAAKLVLPEHLNWRKAHEQEVRDAWRDPEISKLQGTDHCVGCGTETDGKIARLPVCEDCKNN